MTSFAVRHLTVTVARDWREAYAFAHQPRNFARWAAGLASGLRPDGEAWTAKGGPLGDIRIRFSPPNDYGVLDHDVTLPDGTHFHNPLRILPNGSGCEIVFTLFKTPNLDDASFEEDAGTVTRDLQTLKSILETER